MSSTVTAPVTAIERIELRLPSLRDSDEEQVHELADDVSPEPPSGAVVFTRPDVSSVKLQLVSVNFSIFLAGINDASTGALVPYLQPAYNIGLLFVALIYLVNFCGWMLAAFSNVHVTARFGTGGALLFGASLQMLAYALQFWKPPFPMFVVTYFIAGVGTAYQDAQANTLVGNVNNAHRWLGVLHAIYGLGALTSPLVATYIASHTPVWNYFYCIPFGLAVANVTIICAAFWKGLGKGTVAAQERATADLKKTVTNKSVLLLSLFFFLYVGTEVTAGGEFLNPNPPTAPETDHGTGWVVEFLIRVRNGQPAEVGYVASGFWGGLTLGRILLADITFRLGERPMIFVYLALSLAAQLIFWFVPNIIADAVMISLLGFFIGPFFPTGISVATKLLPRELHVAAIGFVATIGQAGSAAFPFLTGAVASKAGVKVLQPILVGLLVAMSVIWALVPQVQRRTA
jgi:fucose permease